MVFLMVGTAQADTPQTDNYDDGFLDASEQAALEESVRCQREGEFKRSVTAAKQSGCPLTFWKCWFLGSIPWSRRMISQPVA